MTPVTGSLTAHVKAFQTLSSDSGHIYCPFLGRLGAGFFSDPFIPPILELPLTQHLLLFIRCFYYQIDYYVHVISIFTANIIACFMQRLLCLYHSRKCKSHLTAFLSEKPFMCHWMNEQSCCFTKES